MLYITEDGGLSFDSFTIPLNIDGELIFHPSKHYQNSILAKTPSRVSIWRRDHSKNTPNEALSKRFIDKFKWSVFLVSRNNFCLLCFCCMCLSA